MMWAWRYRVVWRSVKNLTTYAKVSVLVFMLGWTHAARGKGRVNFLYSFVPPQRPFGRPHVVAEAAGQFFHLLPWWHDTFQGWMMRLNGHALLLLGCALWHKTYTGERFLGLTVQLPAGLLPLYR